MKVSIVLVLTMSGILGVQKSSVSGYVAQSLSCQESSTPVNVSSSGVPDTLITGETLLTISKLTGKKSGHCDQESLLVINGDNVNLTYPLSQQCTKEIKCMFTCNITSGKVVDMFVILNIQRTLKYSISTVGSPYNTTVTEMSPNRTHLRLNKPVDTKFDNCTEEDGFKQDGFTQIINLKTNGGGLFDWQAATNHDSLVVNGLIDYEVHKEFTMNLEVHYTGINASTTSTILVTVIDVDDNDPRFNISGVDAAYTLDIPEGNSSVGNFTKTVPPVFAYDPDFGINQTIHYSIAQQEVYGLFSIDNMTGEIKTTKELDRDYKTTYRIVIRASQTDNPTRAAEALVNVRVIDIDNNLPKFEPTVYEANVTEHVVSGTYVTSLTVIDPDEGDNANFTCILFNTSLPLVVTTVPGGCLIRVKDSNSFDREAFPGGELIFEVGAKATLRGVLGDNNASVIVTLLDINDHSPDFTKDIYSFTLNGVSTGDEVGSIHADDPDAGGNGNVTYDITSSLVQTENCDGSTELPFGLDTVRGNITKSSEPGCDFYKTVVQACDNPEQISNRRCSFSQLVVINNHTSTLQNLSQQVNVTENLPVGAYVDQLKCRGNGYQYVLDSQQFEINEMGFLKTSEILDRENSSTYEVQVQVEDKTMAAICNINVTVSVLDTNDNAPEFVDTPYIFNVPDDVKPGHEIGSVKAVDKDERMNAKIDFHFQTTSETRFEINSTSGSLSVNSVSKACDVITLRVTARDGGIPSIESIATVYVLCCASKTAVPISSPLSKEEIEQMKDSLKRDISQILNSTIEIADIGEVSGDLTEKSRILLASKDSSVDRRQLIESVQQHYGAIKALFYSAQDRMQESQTSGNTFGVPEIALVVMGVLILIGTVAAIVIINKQYKSHKRYKQLYESLTRNSSLYESQEIKVNMDDESSDNDGVIKAQDVAMNGSLLAPILVSAVNPGYVDDEDTVVNQTNIETSAEVNQESNTAVNDVIESLERLSSSFDNDYVNFAASNIPAPSTTDEDVLLVEAEVEGVSRDDIAPAVYANVAMTDQDSNGGAHNTDLSENGRSRSVTPSSDDFERHRRDTEDEINGVGAEPTTEDNTAETVEEEPNPDYNVKQVRFSGEVLDADDNVLQPLKPDKDKVQPENNPKADLTEAPEQSAENDGEMEETVQDEPGWLEEEIDSPRNTVSETENGEDFFFCDDALTHL